MGDRHLRPYNASNGAALHAVVQEMSRFSEGRLTFLPKSYLALALSPRAVCPKSHCYVLHISIVGSLVDTNKPRCVQPNITSSSPDTFIDQGWMGISHHVSPSLGDIESHSRNSVSISSRQTLLHQALGRVWYSSSLIPNDVEEDNHDLNVAHMNNDPFFGIPIPENDSEASSSSDVIPTVVYAV
ncbi:hypothetical protein Tco_0319902 [Tanacetum coccineum]